MRSFFKQAGEPILARLLLVSLIFTLLSPLGLNWALPVQSVKAAGAMIHVTVNTDPAGGPVNGDGCTLREAIDNANNLAAQHPDCVSGTGSNDIIDFQGVTNIAVNNAVGTGEMFIDKPMTIQGPVTLDGGSATRILHIQTGAALSINAVSFTNGYNAGHGGAILVENGSLNGTALNFTSNKADFGGGAVAVIPTGGSGNLTLTNVNFLTNKVDGGASKSEADGGAIYKTGDGLALLTNCAFTGNEAADKGGAIYNAGVGNTLTDGMVITTNAAFTGNFAHAKGFSSGGANTEGGGAIFNANLGSLSLLSNVLFTGNMVDNTDGRGGAIFNAFGATQFLVNQSFFTLNTVTAGANGLGGAIYNRDTMQVIHSSFVANTVDNGGAGGAIASEADPGVDAFVANTTFSGNQAKSGGNGGAIYQFTSGRQLTLYNVTIDSNTAGNGGGIYNNGSTLLVGNTVISNNVGANCSGTGALPFFGDQGHNLEWNGAAAVTCASGVIKGDPKLGGLLPIPPNIAPSAPLNAGSAALNNGDNSLCSNGKVMSTDQNLKIRPLGEPNCDIGAVESSRVPVYNSSPVVPGGTLDIGTTPVGTPKTGGFNVLNTGDDDLTVGLAGGSLATALTGPDKADFTVTVPASFPFTIVAGGPNQPITVQCTPSVTGARNASLSFSTNDPNQPTVTYTLKCKGGTPGYGSTPNPGQTINVGSSTVSVAVSANFSVFETGTDDLTVGLQGGSLATAITGPNKADFTLTAPATFPFTILDGGLAQTVTVKCTPGALGVRTATLTFTTNDPSQPTVGYPLTCTGLAPATPGYGSTPAPGQTIDAGSATVGTPVSNNFSVFETGNATLTVGLQGGSIATAITGLNAADFTLTAPAFPFNILDGGAAQAVTLKCTPSAIGARTATLTFTTNDPSQATVSYPLTCNGQAVPVAGYGSTPNPGQTINVGSSGVGVGVTTNFTVNETGNATLTVGLQGGSVATAITGPNKADFTLTAPAFPFNILDGGAAQTVTVQCTPGGAGPRTATLTFTTNDPTQATVSYPLTCNGVAAGTPGYGSTPNPGQPINVGSAVAGATVSNNFSVFETGSATLTVGLQGGSLATAITGPNAADFTLPAPVFPFNILNGGAAQSITVQCTPAGIGSRTATLTFTTNDPGQPTVSYPLSCTGQAAATPGYGSNPAPGSTITLGTLAGTPTGTSIQVSETGTAQLNITSIILSNNAQFSLASASSFSIPDGGASQPISLQCNSATPGSFSTTVTVAHNAPGSPAVYTINCTVAPVAANTPGYGSNPLPGSTLSLTTPAGTAATATIAVSETGTATLNVTGLALSNTAQFALLSPASFSIPDGGASQNVLVQCNSAVAGTFSTTLTVSHNAAGTPAIYTITCTVTTAAPPTGGPGYGSVPGPGSTIVVGTPAIGNRATFTLKVLETGTAALVVQSYTLSGPQAGEFSLASPAFPFTIPDGGAAQNVLITCIPRAKGLRLATLSFVTNAGNQSYNLRCGVGANTDNEQPPADLIAQLRITPDRVAANNPENLIVYSFKVKNIGVGAASGIQVRFPIDPQLTLGYPAFGTSQAWVSQVTTDTVFINLPTLEPNTVVTGTLTFRPNRLTPPVVGSRVFTRYEVHFSDPTAPDRKSLSNAVTYRFGPIGSNLDDTKGNVQLMSEGVPTGGSALTYKTNFFIPDEIVSVWLTRPDGTSFGLPGTRAGSNGEISLVVNPIELKLLPGTYTVATYGNRSELTVRALLVIAPATLPTKH